VVDAVQARADDIVGLLNGVDNSVWNPAVDPIIPARYSAGLSTVRGAGG